jgi:Holliday junction resolvase RusA-like endonuclease
MDAERDMNERAVTFLLPLPPSTNNLFHNSGRGGRRKTKNYRQWIERAGWELARQHPLPVTGSPVGVSIRLRRPNKQSDLDNRAKAVLDLLVTHRLISDDRDVSELHMYWEPIEGPLGCRVSIYPTEGTTNDAEAAA